MATFVYILSNNIIPIFTIITLGYLLSRKFNLNIFTLSKLCFFLFVPAFMFVSLYTTELKLDMLMVLVYIILYLMVNGLLAKAVAVFRRYDVSMMNAFRNSIMFNNSGNIGVSLITLVFSSAPYAVDGKLPYLEEALAAQIIILMVMNITSNTLGFYFAGKAKMSLKDSLRQIFTMPSIYVVPLALLLNLMRIDITASPVWNALVYIKGGLVPMALITLGVQLSRTKFNFGSIDVYIAVFTRLILGPALAFIMIMLFGFTGVVAQTALIACSVPTAVNTALIAVECDNNQDFAAQAVMMSTIFSAVTLTLSIYAAGVLFPL
jgi:predicted permease